MNCASKYSRFKESPVSNSSTTKVDKNIFEVSLECLKLPILLSTGDPYRCSTCQSVFSSSCKILLNDEQKVFLCSCCGTLNPLSIEEDEIPKTLDQNYLLEKVTTVHEDQPLSETSLDASSIIFCIDTSGSMAMGQDVDAGQWVKTKKVPNKDGKIKVSRLECVQAAVDSQIRVIDQSFPMRKVGLVEFNSSVVIVGDGEEVFTVDRSMLNDFALLMNFAQNTSGRFMNRNIKHSYKNLLKRIYDLKPNGGTALGPALLISIVMASESGPGSKVVLCTDGQANEGVGSLNKSEGIFDFYKEIGGIAKELGVSVSIVSIEGQDCRLDALNYVTSQTEGDIFKVSPDKLLTQFSNIIQDEIIATEVSIQVNLHKAVKFYNENPEFLTNNDSTYIKYIGNATQFTSFSFQYVLKSDEELSALGLNKSELRSLHLQSIITYRGKDHNKYMKVMNKIQDVVFGSEIVEEKIDAEVLMRAGRREAARLMEEGKTEEARLRSEEWAVVIAEEVKDQRGAEFKRDMDEVNEAVEEFDTNCRYTDTRMDFMNRMKKNRK